MIKIPEEILKDIKGYRAKVQEYHDGKIDPIRFKPYRVAMGIYEEREPEVYMVRTRIPAGVVTLEQLKKVKELADKFGNSKIHITTRQDIQFHKITLENTANIIEGLMTEGIITRGTGGNTARNVGCSALSGVDLGEVFDVTEYALETTNYLLKDPSVLNLPRKYKIAFSNDASDTGNATIADLGFVAKTKEGKKGFEVYGAGGLGGNSRVSIKLEEFILENEVLYHVQAMKEIFELEGDRTNKHKARIRHILERLGEEKFIALYKQQIEKVKEKEIMLNLKGIENKKAGGNTAKSISNLLVEQKEKGLYSVYIHPENGNISTENLQKIIDFIDALSYGTTIRLTNTQGFYVRDLRGEDADKLLQLIQNFASSFDIDNSVACAGSATCKLGLCLSQSLLSAIRRDFEEVEDNIKSQLPRVFISGCPNSCGQHQKGKIGLSGKAKRTEDGLVPMYTIHLNGNVGAGEARLGEASGDIPAKKISAFLYELAKIKEKSGLVDFEAFLRKEKEAVDALINELSKVESEKENPALYYDFGSEEKFSLKGRGPGECSAGVLDVIKLDLSNAKAYLEEFNTTKNSQSLYDAGVSASRALLVLKGIDTNKDREIFKEFVKYFVETGYVKSSIKDLTDTLLDFKLGDVENLEKHHNEVVYLIEKVVAMYESLNPQLEITLQKEEEKEGNFGLNKDVHKATDVLNIIDLRGVKCPMNFVKAKVALAKIAVGEEVGFYLDDNAPINNVPKSIEEEGHQIVKIDREYAGYNLLVIRKQ